ncbi:195_t:CDS:2 [Paraglomus occultum]|uniref:195_t:CDS:1 n=1 Tax=Paraglomus occultum TaxID=144539 RepID=A0A9N9BWC0_9GLOM|nr:195_t:CDS:2 [Paraglomus occultum]
MDNLNSSTLEINTKMINLMLQMEKLSKNTMSLNKRCEESEELSSDEDFSSDKELSSDDQFSEPLYDNNVFADNCQEGLSITIDSELDNEDTSAFDYTELMIDKENEVGY